MVLLSVSDPNSCTRYFSDPKHWHQAAKAVSADRDVLVDLFERIENFLRRLETYVDVQPTLGMTDIIVKVMVEVLFILGIATKEINQNSASELIPGIEPCLSFTIVQKHF